MDLGSSVHVCSAVGTGPGTSGDLSLYLCLRCGVVAGWLGKPEAKEIRQALTKRNKLLPTVASCRSRKQIEASKYENAFKLYKSGKECQEKLAGNLNFRIVKKKKECFLRLLHL